MHDPGLSSRKHGRHWREESDGPDDHAHNTQGHRGGDTYDHTSFSHSTDTKPSPKRFRSHIHDKGTAPRARTSLSIRRPRHTTFQPHSETASSLSQERSRNTQLGTQLHEAPLEGPSQHRQTDLVSSGNDGICAWIRCLLHVVETCQMSQSFEYIIRRFGRSESAQNHNATPASAVAQALAHSDDVRQSAIIELIQRSADLLSTRMAQASLQRQMEEQAELIRSVQDSISQLQRQQLRRSQDPQQLAAVERQVADLSDFALSHDETLQRHSLKIRWLQDQVPTMHKPLSEQQQECSGSEDGEIQDEGASTARKMRDLLKEHLRNMEERFIPRNDAQHVEAVSNHNGRELSTMKAAADFLEELRKCR